MSYGPVALRVGQRSVTSDAPCLPSRIFLPVALIDHEA